MEKNLKGVLHVCVQHTHFAVRHKVTALQTKYTLIKIHLKRKERFHCRIRVSTIRFNVLNNALKNKYFNARKSKDNSFLSQIVMHYREGISEFIQYSEKKEYDDEVYMYKELFINLADTFLKVKLKISHSYSDFQTAFYSLIKD